MSDNPQYRAVQYSHPREIIVIDTLCQGDTVCTCSSIDDAEMIANALNAANKYMVKEAENAQR